MVIPRIVCKVDSGTLRVELVHRARVRWAAETTWDDPDSLREAVAHLAGHDELPWFVRTIAFELEPTVVQRRTLEGLPPVGARALADLVAISPHRYFRRGAVPLVTAVRWSGKRADRIADAVAVELPLVQALVRGAREAGLTLVGIGARGCAGMSLLPPDEHTRRDARRLRWSLRLGTAAAIAWLLLGTGILAQQMIARQRMEARLAQLQGPLAAVLAAEASADSARRMIAVLEEDARHEADVIGTLLRVTAVLPDSAFLTQVRVDSVGVGLAAGAARRPAAVLAALEGRARLRRPRFEGRTSQDLVGGRRVERFAIGFGGGEDHP